jgi:hypothetical protein
MESQSEFKKLFTKVNIVMFFFTLSFVTVPFIYPHDVVIGSTLENVDFVTLRLFSVDFVTYPVSTDHVIPVWNVVGVRRVDWNQIRNRHGNPSYHHHRRQD